MPANMQNQFSWDDVRVLLALFRTRTLSSAAVRLGANPSTVGRRLDALEDALGARLFDRTPDGVAPTAATEHLLAHAERLEQAAYALGGAVEGFETRTEGVVRITAPPGVADHFLAPALPRLLSRYPDIRVELDASVRSLDLTRREADLALRAVRPESGDLVAVKIADEQDRLFTSRAARRPCTSAALAARTIPSAARLSPGTADPQAPAGSPPDGRFPCGSS
jgi:DNA-binding transcriptional LysR family regulator